MTEGIIIGKEGQKLEAYIPNEGKTYRAIPRKKVFRKYGNIYVGDRFRGTVVDRYHVAIEEILERKNVIHKPNIANIEKALIVITIDEPPLSLLHLDKLTVAYEYSGVDAMILINKADITDEEDIERIRKIYEPIGYPVLPVSAKTGLNLDRLVEMLGEGIYVLSGASGVGKSSIIKALTGVDIRTQEVSEKTRRGRQTTVGIRLYPVKEGTFLADTPGFSRLHITKLLRKEEVRLYFREFNNYRCAFSNCMHVKEDGCAVRKAVERGEIPETRYQNYLKILQEYED